MQPKTSLPANSRLVIIMAGLIIFASCERTRPTEIKNTTKPEQSNFENPTTDQPVTIVPADPELTEEPPDDYPRQFGVELSPEAKAISLLLDKRSFTAADTLFNNYLPYKTDDATLYCQYVRYLIERYPLAEDTFIETPLLRGDKFNTIGTLEKAIVLASEFDASLKPHLADFILKSLHDQIESKALAKQGYIGSSSEIIGGWFGPTHKINFAWKAIDLDAPTGKKWAEKYESLVPVFSKLGMCTSAMWTANLSADLSNGADKDSDLDFERATGAFVDAIGSEKCSADRINDTSVLYTKIFSAEIKKASTGRKMAYFQLLNEIKHGGGSLKLYEEAGALPVALMPNSNTSRSGNANVQTQNR